MTTAETQDIRSPGQAYASTMVKAETHLILKCRAWRGDREIRSENVVQLS